MGNHDRLLLVHFHFNVLNTQERTQHVKKRLAILPTLTGFGHTLLQWVTNPLFDRFKT